MTPAEQLHAVRTALAAKAKYDPLLFAEAAWTWGEGNLKGEDIRIWQADLMDEISQHLADPETRYKVGRFAVASGHGIGKSALTGMLTSWALSCWRDPRIVITANTETQLRNKTSPEVGQWVKSSLYGDLFDTDTLSIRLKADPAQHRADFETNSENNQEAFAGLHAKGRLVMMIVDEASQLPESIYETILGALTDENTVLLFIMMGNPTSATGAFREAFRKKAKFWKTWNIDSRDVEGTDKDFLQQIIDEFGENSNTAKRRVRGIFPTVTENQFIPTNYVDAAYGRHLTKDQYEFAPVIISCDPAWTGDDLLVISKRQGLRFDILEVMEKNHNDVNVAMRIAHHEVQHNADAVFIDQGHGTGIYSAGLSMGREWELVSFGGKASQPGYLNLRAEMYANGRKWLAEGGSIPMVQRLYDDLVSIEIKPDNAGVIKLKSKPDMKRDGLPSTDYSDAWALTFARPVVKKEKIEHLAEQQRLARRQQGLPEPGDEVFEW